MTQTTVAHNINGRDATPITTNLSSGPSIHTPRLLTNRDTQPPPSVSPPKWHPCPSQPPRRRRFFPWSDGNTPIPLPLMLLSLSSPLPSTLFLSLSPPFSVCVVQREPPEARRLRVAFPPERAAGEKGGRRGRRGAPLLSLCLSSATSRGSLLSGGGRARADGRRGRFGGWGRDSGLNSLELTHSR